MPYEYAYQGDAKNTAKAVARNVQISHKTAIMVANHVRGKSVARAKRDLQEVMDKKQAVKFTRFSEGAGHKKKIGPGKYPYKAAEAFLKAVESVEANALDQGLGDDLTIISVTAQQGPKTMRYGRHRGRERKSTHIELVVEGPRAAPEEKTDEAKTPEQPTESQEESEAPAQEPEEAAEQAGEEPQEAPAQTPDQEPEEEPAESEEALGEQEEERADEPEEKTPDHALTDLPGVGESTADALEAAGFTTVEEIASTTTDYLTKADGIGKATAQKLINAAKEMTQ